MSATFPDRITGGLGDTRSTLTTIARRCGVEPDPESLEAALAVHLRGARAVQQARPGAVQLLVELRSRGLGTALVSDCSSELVELWPAHPLAALINATVFSWECGYRKPDPRMFATAAELLGVAPEHCLNVGDGGGRELTGAARAGMTPVLVSNTDHPSAAAFRVDADDTVPEHVVADPAQLPALIDRLRRR